jgi:glutamine synthetase
MTASPIDVQKRLEAAGVRALAINWVDTAGIARVKLVPTRRIAAVAERGLGWSDIWAVVTIDEHYAAVPPFDTPSGDARLVPAVSEARQLLHQPAWAWAPVDIYSQELVRSPVCPRGAVEVQMARLAELGLSMQATFEIEMVVLQDGDPVRPAHTGPGYSPRALFALEGFAVDLMDALEAQDVPVDAIHPEYSPGQFEVSIAPANPLHAADQLLLLRFTARHVARRHGLELSFAPVVVAGGLGSGCHLHLSLWRDGANLMGDGIQPEGRSAIAGILAELPGIMAVAAPSVPSYIRLQPGHWSGAYAIWGIENREAALRFIPGTVSTGGRAANVEVKTVDGAANPHLAMATVLAAAVSGVQRSLPLADPVQQDPQIIEGAVRLPATLGEAAEAFAASTVLREGLGELLHDTLTGVRRMEWEEHKDDDEAALIELHRFKY